MSDRSSRQNARRVFIYGAGRGGALVVEILSVDSQVAIVGFVDDDPQLWKQTLPGLPVVGGGDSLKHLKRSGCFDALVLSMATPTTMHMRRRLYLDLKAQGFEFINAIHSAAVISPSASLGENNVISAGSVIATDAHIGDNNRISAHCNIEHHSLVGSHNFFGAHCTTGGAVKIGNECVFGQGVIIESLVQIGDGVQVTSGAVLRDNVPSGSAIGD